MLTIIIAIVLALYVLVFGMVSIWQDDYQRENIKRELDRKYGRQL